MPLDGLVTWDDPDSGANLDGCAEGQRDPVTPRRGKPIEVTALGIRLSVKPQRADILHWWPDPTNATLANCGRYVDRHSRLNTLASDFGGMIAVIYCGHDRN
jgi:hypothetical protein